MGSWHVFLLWLEVQCGYLACLPTLARGAVWVAGMSPYSGLQSCRPVTTWDFPFCYEGRVDEGHGPGGIEAQMRLVRNLSCLPQVMVCITVGKDGAILSVRPYVNIVPICKCEK